MSLLCQHVTKPKLKKHCMCGQKALSTSQLQVADFLNDAVTLELDARALAQHCLAADWYSREGSALLLALLELSPGLLHATLRSCNDRATPSACLKTLPQMLHRAYLAARAQPLKGGLHLSFAALPRDNFRKSVTPDPREPLSADVCAVLCAQLPQLRDLVSMDLSGCALAGEQFGAAMHALSSCAQLRRLRLARCDPGRIGIHALAECMCRWQLHDLDLSELQQHTAEPVHYEMRPTADALADSIARQTALTHLGLRDWPRTERLVAALQHLSLISSIDFASPCKCYYCQDVSGCGLGSFTHMQHLTWLDISRTSLRFEPCKVPACPLLRHLNINHAHSDKEAPVSWAATPALEHLEMLGTAVTQNSTATAAALSQLQQLTHLCIGYHSIVVGAQQPAAELWQALASSIAKMTSLQVLRLAEPSECEPHQQVLCDAVALLPALRTLECDVPPGGKLFSTGHGDSQPLHVLTELHLRIWCDAESDAAEALRMDEQQAWRELPTLTRLQRLTLELRDAADVREGCTSVDCVHDELCAALQPLTQLCDLHVKRAGFDLLDDWLLALQELTRLQLNGCDIRAGLFEPLRLRRLVHLALVDCELSRDDLLELVQRCVKRDPAFACRALGVLDVRGDALVSASDIEAMLDAIAKTKLWHVVLRESAHADFRLRPRMQKAVERFNAAHVGQCVVLLCEDYE